MKKTKQKQKTKWGIVKWQTKKDKESKRIMKLPMSSDAMLDD